MLSFPAGILGRNRYHPAHPEAVGDHAEAGRPESFAKRHLHLPAFGQRGEFSLRIGFIGRRERQ
jgi:hypothetical protein